MCIVQKPKKISQEQQKLNQIYNLIKKYECVCDCNGNKDLINEGIIDTIV